MIRESSCPVGHALADLSFTFRKPLFCDVDYELTLHETKPGQVKVTVKDAGRLMLTGRLGYRSGGGANQAIWYSDFDPLIAAAQRSTDELQAGLVISGEYGPACGKFGELLNRWQISQ